MEKGYGVKIKMFSLIQIKQTAESTPLIIPNFTCTYPITYYINSNVLFFNEYSYTIELINLELFNFCFFNIP